LIARIAMIAKTARIARLAQGIAVIALLSLIASAQAPVGVSRELARERAQRIVDVRYELAYTLVAAADSTAGEEEIKFRYKPQQLLGNGPLRPTAPGPLLLDFREGTVSKLVVNGKELPVKMENGHIEIPEELLKITKKTESQGEQEARQSTTATDNLGRPVGAKPGARIPDSPDDNIIKIEFTAPIAAAGKALTRYVDKDDNAEYIYTLFVPMDASMAFPCFDQPDLKAEFYLRVTAPEDWVVISNSDVENLYSSEPGKRLTIFERTKPISTYLFAFAAGPFSRVHPARACLTSMSGNRS